MDCIIKKITGEKLEYLYQWDKNQEIIIVLKPENKFTVLSEIENVEIEIHFWTKNSKKAKIATSTLTRNTIKTKIPNDLLKEGNDINLFVFLKRGNIENTIAKNTITVIKRIEKEDITP